MELPEWDKMHSVLQVSVKSAVFGRFCFARAYRDRSETYRQRNINSKHTVHALLMMNSAKRGLNARLKQNTLPIMIAV